MEVLKHPYKVQRHYFSLCLCGSVLKPQSAFSLCLRASVLKLKTPTTFASGMFYFCQQNEQNLSSHRVQNDTYQL